ncbi:MAG: peptidoglycan bridge formation glycyltransferase FemA/FemB family protein [Anaerolineales bacterium]|nr:peptidoglycan bridge formation glycyltransferase FemA/FemB family protein [Anaerolineales bacterium]
MDLHIKSIHSADEWNNTILGLPNPHLLQSWEWGAFKESYGWRAGRLLWLDSSNKVHAAAQILERDPIASFSILYCPRGPVLDWSNGEICEKVILDLMRIATEKSVIFLKIDPQVEIVDESKQDAMTEASENPLQWTLNNYDWRPSDEQVQFRNTLILDLSPSEDEILSGMKQKTRYNIRLASRRGVQVRMGSLEDLNLLYTMYAETSLRDGFTIRDPEYYQAAWGSFIEKDMAMPFIAEVEGEPVAGLIAYQFGGMCWYLYGMSREVHREKMPSYLLQWEAIRWAKSSSCDCYDFWGAPDEFDESDPMWGVYRFKKGFGADIVNTIGAWDYASRPLMYWIYNTLLPRLLALMRARGRTLTKRSLE